MQLSVCPVHSMNPSHGEESVPQPQTCSQSSNAPLLCACRPRGLPFWLQVLAESCKAAAENGGTAKTPQDIMMSYARSFMTSPVFKASQQQCVSAQSCALASTLLWSRPGVVFVALC